MAKIHYDFQKTFAIVQPNNDLSEFGVDSQAPDLFNNDSESSNSDELLSSENEDLEDDLEIPAFLRRQKN